MGGAAAIDGALKSMVTNGMRVDFDVPITMDDGLVLRADVFRPDDDAPVPVIASMGPYAKGLTFEAGYPRQWKKLNEMHPDASEGSSSRFTAWELVDPEQWIPLGYGVVRIDSRGGGRSPGHVDVWGPREADDYHDCIEWIADQSWSTGRIGLCGISYYAKNQWQVAERRPAHLSAICVWEGANDYYREMTHHGGIHNAFLPRWYNRMDTIQYGLGSRGFRNPVSGLLASGDEDLTDEQMRANREDLPAQLIEHPFDDEWHAAHSSEPENIEVPLLSAANWGGLGQHARGNMVGWMRAGSEQKWLEIHGGTHWEHFYTPYGRTLQRRFFDHFLKDEGDWLEQPRVSLNIRHPDEVFELRGEDEWPIARTDWQRHHLDLAGETLTREAPAEPAQRTYDAMGEGVTLWSPPLTEQTEITGPMAARLYVSSSTEDADLFLVFRGFRPDGSELLFSGANDPNTPLSQGWLRASHRALDPERSTPWMPVHPHTHREPLTPGEVVELDIELWATSIVLPAGFRFALTILGRDFDHGLEPVTVGNLDYRGCGPFLHEHPEDRPAEIFDNQVTLHADADRQPFLLLPVIPPPR